MFKQRAPPTVLAATSRARLYQPEKVPSIDSSTFFYTDRMETTVGAMLASFKLAVAQGDLHLVGSSVDQLIIQFDQEAFDEFLAADQIKTDKAKRCHYRPHAAASRPVLATPSF